MQISLYNDLPYKVYANVNGINYIIEPGHASKANCVEGLPVNIHLSRKQKSWTILNLFDPDMFDLATGIMFESVGLLELEPTYVLTCTGGNDLFFRIISEEFACDKYYVYSRLCLDDPFIKNNCTYEIIRQKRVQKRVRLFNVYTALLALGFVGMLIEYFVSDVTLSTLFESKWLDECGFCFLLLFAGICGKIRVILRYKKVTKQQFMNECFSGRVEEYKEKW